MMNCMRRLEITDRRSTEPAGSSGLFPSKQSALKRTFPIESGNVPLR